MEKLSNWMALASFSFLFLKFQIMKADFKIPFSKTTLMEELHN